MMRRICAWCQADLGTTGDGPDSAVITHGICETCAAALFSQLGVSMQQFLDRLPAPLLVVDDSGIVVGANQRAQILLGKDLPEIYGQRGGNVIECAYAYLPEGCGHTVHCRGCAIRNAVEETYATGKSLQRVPGYADGDRYTGPAGVRFLISTEKVGEVVLLRIDERLPEVTVPEEPRS